MILKIGKRDIWLCKFSVVFTFKLGFEIVKIRVGGLSEDYRSYIGVIA